MKTAVALFAISSTLAAALAAGPPQAADLTPGLQTVVDPMTDEKTLTLVVPGEGGHLTVSCKQGKADMYVIIFSNTYLGPVGPKSAERAVDYRIDKDPLTMSRWSYTGQTAGQGGQLAVSLTRNLAVSNTFTARLYAYDGGQPIHTFKVAPHRASLVKLLDDCAE